VTVPSDAAGHWEKLQLIVGHDQLSPVQKTQALVLGTPPMRRLGSFLMDIGERHSISWLVYNPANFLWWHGAELSSAPGVAQALDSAFPRARRFADVGAGTGVFGAALSRRGRDVVACEHDRFGRWLARQQGLDVVPLDLGHDPPAALSGPVDVAFCFEVAEHLPPDLGDRLVAFLSALAPAVVFSAAHRGQGGEGHVNEQSREYWRERFADQGMSEDEALTARLSAELGELRAVPWLGRNVMVLRRHAPGT
jgi:SAM-dependent methyltransferase